MNAQDYLDAVKLKLAMSNLVREAQIVQEYGFEDTGFFRARLGLLNDDFLELSEYFIIVGEVVEVVQYRYQWMDSNRRNLRKRWDNAMHHPELSNFPHHVHVGAEDRVESGRRMSIIELLVVLESEIGIKS